MAMNDGGTSQLVCHTSTVTPTLKIAERIWSPSNAADAALVIAHGGMWHSGWFGQLGDTISSNSEVSIRVSCTDHPSHGLSDDVVPEMRGYVSNFDTIAMEVGAAVKRARAVIGQDKPIFVLGESMGGLVVLSGLTDNVISDVSGFILCGALVEFSPALRPPRFAIPLMRIAAFVRPTLAFPMPIGGETFEKAFGNPEAAKLARADELTIDMAPPRVGMLVKVLDAVSRVLQRGSDNIRAKSLLFMHYTEDLRTSYEDTKIFVESLKHVPDKVIYAVDGTAHQFFQDMPEKCVDHIAQVTQFLVDRVDKS